MNRSRLFSLFAAVLLLAAYGCDDACPPPGPAYRAQVVWTEYGIPHVLAEDWGSLGYGHGYSYARDNYCIVMREIVFANGQSAEYMGEDGGDVGSDFIFTFLHGDEDSFQSLLDAQPAYLKELVEGYAHGMNRYLEEVGASGLPEGAEGCRDALWVRKITALDLWKYLRRIALQGSTDNGMIRRAIIDARGPDGGRLEAPTAEQLEEARRRLSAGFRDLRDASGGSNAIALGGDYTRTGTGMLLGNPHQPWRGSGRWY